MSKKELNNIQLFLEQVSSHFNEHTSYSVGHLGLGLLIANEFNNKFNNNNYYLVAGTEDLKCLLPLLDLTREGKNAYIWIRHYIHSEAIYLQNYLGKIYCFWFDPQAWGIKYYPNRNLVSVLNEFDPNIEIFTAKSEIQSKSGIGTCDAHTFHFINTLSKKNNNILKYLLNYKKHSEDINIESEWQFEKKINVLDDLPNQFKKYQENNGNNSVLSINNFQKRIYERVLNSILKNYQINKETFDWKSIDNISAKVAGLNLPLNSSAQFPVDIFQEGSLFKIVYHSKSITHLKYANFLYFSNIIYPKEIENSARVLFNGNINFEKLTIVWTTENIHNFIENINYSIDKTSLFAQGMRQRLALKTLKNDIARAIENFKIDSRVPVACSGLIQNNDTSERLRASLKHDIINIINTCLESPLSVNANEISFDLNQDNNIGFDSISLIKLAENINIFYKICITPIIFFKHKNLNNLINYLLDSYREQINKYYSLHAPLATNTNSHTITVKQENTSSNNNENSSDNVAIIGMNCLFPGANNIWKLWDILIKNKCTISKVPRIRWKWQDYFGNPLEKGNKTFSKFGGFIKNVFKFDASFFSLSEKEASEMDPAQRLLLQSVWHMFEDAGYKPSYFSGSEMGVFIGAGESDYLDFIRSHSLHDALSYSTTNSNSVLANRISYQFNFNGPSETCGGGCAAAILAIDKAINYIQSGKCDYAIAGAVHLIFTPNLHIAFDKAGVLSKTGIIRPYDNNADGYIRSEGLGTLLLKSFDKALADKDYIYGVIKGIQTHHGGRGNSFTSPNPVAQEKVIIKTFEKANIAPETVCYLEGQGTATLLGDGIEVMAIESALNRLNCSNNHQIGIGSIKSNIGHTEEVSGIASLIKVILCMKHKKIPSTLHYNQLNSMLLNSLNFTYIVDKPVPWQPTRIDDMIYPLRGSVHTISSSGINTHLVIEDYESQLKRSVTSNNIFILSAHSTEALKKCANKLYKFLHQSIIESFDLSQIAYTLQIGREEFKERLAIIAHSLEELKCKLNSFIKEGIISEDIFLNNNIKDEFKTEKASELHQLAYSWVNGKSVTWSTLYKDELPGKVPLPGYPFNNTLYLPFIKSELKTQKDRKKYLHAEFSYINNFEPCKFTDYPQDSSVFDLFKSQALKTPLATAAIFETEKITYQALLNKVELLTSKICNAVSTPQTYIGIYLNRSINMLVGLLAIMKSGNIYIPLDPIYPANRIKYIINDTKLNYILTDTTLLDKLPFYKGQHITISGLSHNTELVTYQDNNQPNLSYNLKKEKLAYLIYTSGSTGNPKGVQIYQHSLSNFLRSMINKPGFTSKDYILAITTICFDIAVLELYLPLITGGVVEIVSDKVCRDGNLLKEKIANSPTTVLQATPATWELLIQSEWEGKFPLKMLCGGEKLGEQLAFELLKRGSELWNMYGPTETTVWSMVNKISDAKYISLGHPVDNTYLYILDENLKPVTKGAIGELYIGGEGTSKGYFNNIELTKSNFISLSNKNNFLIYKTGDQVLYTDKGEIIYQGRNDEQIKLRGYRIELGEIEACLKNLAEISQALVVLRNDNDNPMLVAFCQFNKEVTSIELFVVESHLKNHLPEYMIPSLFIPLNSFPMLLNNKIDKKTLSSQNLAEIERQFGNNKIKIIDKEHISTQQEFDGVINTSHSISDILVELVAKVVITEKDKINLLTSFNDLGINSIKISSFCLAINKKLNINIKPLVLYKYSNIQQLSNYIIDEHQTVLKGLSFYPSLQNNNKSSIAIIGISGRFPQSKSPAIFWENLVAGKDMISEVPLDRWHIEQHYANSMREKNKTNSKWGGFIPDLYEFDASFFKVSPREAILMDPRQRKLLEVTWQLFEDAGYMPEHFSGTNTGVYIGAINSEYWDLQRDQGISYDGYTLSGVANSILANRISYLYNLNGPSEVIDTACSSSLVAINSAINAIHMGNCDMAIAGGVNLLLNQHLYIALSKNGMLSPDGRCKAFDKSANGYVRAECIAAILLKPLEHAIKDNDHIYAVISGSGVNHGGKSNSLTAPNPLSQTKLLVDIYTKNNIDPTTISLIETHGTGTQLGDPIEIEGIKEAFSTLSSKHNKNLTDVTCTLGALKSNMGHAEAAAGIAGIIKVVLAMQNNYIPANLHHSHMNPHIKLEGTNIFLTNQGHQWKNKTTQKDGSQPKRAGINSFGFGGTNAHIVLEEYDNHYSKTDKDDEVNAIILSAKSKSSLKAYAQSLLNFLNHHITDQNNAYLSITNISYTLQKSRTPMNERIAIVAYNLHDLANKLSLYINNPDNCPEVFCSSNATLAIDHTDDNFLNQLMAEKNINMLAKLWVNGTGIDWKLLYKDKYPKVISLPTYPFETTHYSLNKNNSKSTPIANTPNLFKFEKISSTISFSHFKMILSKEDVLIKDHIINGKYIVPAVVIIEIALNIGHFQNQNLSKVIELKNLTLLNPIILQDDTKEINIEINLSEFFSKMVIYTESMNKRKDHAQCLITFHHKQEKENLPFLELESIKMRCKEKIMSHSFYKMLEQKNYYYGTAYNSINTLFKNENEALSIIKYPFEHIEDIPNQYLAPIMLEGALQTLAGLLFSENINQTDAFLPFFIEKLIIFKPLEKLIFAYVSKESQVNRATEQKHKYQILIFNAKHHLIGKINGYRVRSHRLNTTSISNQIFYNIEMKEIQYPTSPQNLLVKDPIVLISDNLKFLKQKHSKFTEIFSSNPSILGLLIDNQFEKLANQMFKISLSDIEEVKNVFKQFNIEQYSSIDFIYFYSPLNNRDAHFDIYRLYNLVKFIFHFKLKMKVNIYFVYESLQSIQLIYLRAINGLFKCLNKENKNYNWKLVEFDNTNDDICYQLSDEIKYSHSEKLTNQSYISYGNKKRFIQQFKEITLNGNNSLNNIIKENGIYIILGGTGGLGLMLADHFARQKRINLILIGRSELSREHESKLLNIQTVTGSKLFYNKIDITNFQAVRNYFDELKNKFGSINGLVHCAAQLNDKLFINKTYNEFIQVVKSKLDSTLNVDNCLGDEKLDFFILYSSISSTLGNIAQSDYCYTNSFLDNFAFYREQLRKLGKRYGITRVINWPLWEEGGIKLDSKTKEIIHSRFGTIPLTTQLGLNIFNQIVTSQYTQVIVMSGEKVKMRELFTDPTTLATSLTSQANINMNSRNDYTYLLRADLTLLIKNILQINSEEIDIHKNLSDFGFDSISFTELSNQISQLFNVEIQPTLFFDLDPNTLNTLVDYLINDEMDKISQYYSNNKYNTDNSNLMGKNENEVEENKSSVNTPYTYLKNEPIAIIGLSGKLPQSKDLDDYWFKQELGHEFISEVDSQRWDWQEYYDPSMQKENSTFSKWGAFLENVDQFDAHFFNIKEEEAILIDPQHRLTLEHVWLALENAGYNPRSLAGTSTGVYIGVTNRDYLDRVENCLGKIDVRATFGNTNAFISNRVSHYLNFHGPSESIDTLCSSSLVTIHRAVEDLRSGRCQLAIAGGVSIIASPRMDIAFSQAGMLSKTGHCKPCDNEADGFVRGEGIGILVLKPLSKAKADKDYIHAIIRATGTNHAGHANTLTSPNMNAQKNLIVDTYRKANIDATQISYLETHTTGTVIGDAVEINAIKKAFSELNPQQILFRCGISSIKSNIGHLEAAAGMAGIINILLALKYKKLPALNHLKEKNSYIDIENSPFYFVTKSEPWIAKHNEDGNQLPRCAGINSFGAAGTNAHVVIEEYLVNETLDNSFKNSHIILLSGDTEKQLKKQARLLLEHIQKVINIHDPLFTISNIAYTLQVGRNHNKYRIAFIVNSFENLIDNLSKYLTDENNNNTYFNTNSNLSNFTQQTPDTQSDNNEYKNLLDAWLKGNNIDWQVLHTNHCYRVPLPSTNFNKKSYWIDSIYDNSFKPLNEEIPIKDKELVEL